MGSGPVPALACIVWVAGCRDGGEDEVGGGPEGGAQGPAEPRRGVADQAFPT